MKSQTLYISAKHFPMCRCGTINLPNSRRKIHKLFFLAAGFCLGAIVTLINNSPHQVFKQEPTLTRRTKFDDGPYKVPGPDSLCSSNETYQDGQAARTIFYVDLSGEECLTARQACGIESAAVANPKMKIKVYTNTAPLGPPNWDYLANKTGWHLRNCAYNRRLHQLSSRNVQIIRQDLGQLLTDLQPSLHSFVGRTKGSLYWKDHLGDSLRLALLNNHGGFYLDLGQYLVLRPLHCLNTTILTYQTDEKDNERLMDTNVMAMEAGHPFLKYSLSLLSKIYDPADRDAFGSKVLTEVFKFACDDNDDPIHIGTFRCRSGKIDRHRSNLTIINPQSFTPIQQYEDHYFYSAASMVGFDRRPFAEAFMARLWSDGPQEVKPNSLYARLARQYCPTTWHENEAVGCKNGNAVC